MRGRVLARDQQREGVADDFLVAEAVVLSLGRQHGLQEVLGSLEQLRSLPHPRTGLLDEGGHREPQLGHRALHGAIGGQSHPAPVGNREEAAEAERLEHHLDVVLQLAAVAARACTQVVAERKRGHDVERVRGELLADVEHPPRACRLAQSPVQPLRRGVHNVEVTVQVVGVQGRDRKAPLSSPGLALDREDAGEAELRERRLDLAHAPVALGTFAQGAIDLVHVAHDDSDPSADTELENRPVPIAPPLDRPERVVRPAHLVQVADQLGSALGARQTGD